MPPNSRLAALGRLGSLVRGGARSAVRVARGRPITLADSGEGAAGGLMQESFVRRLERLSLMTRGLMSVGVAGEHRSRRHASSVEFSDFRRYVPGDDFRRIDWNAYARLDGIFIKLTEAKVEVPVHLLLDCSQSMNWGTPNKLAYARRLAAAIGYLGLAQFDAVSGAGFADQLYPRFPTVRGKNQATRLLSYLDAAPVGQQSKLERSIAEYCDMAPRGGVAFVISDLLSDDSWQSGLLHLLRHGTDVVVIQIVSPQELHPMLDGEIELIDAESGDVVELVVGDEARRTYEARTEEWCESVEGFCHRSEISHLLLDTTVELEEIFLNRMRQRRIVR